MKYKEFSYIIRRMRWSKAILKQESIVGYNATCGYCEKGGAPSKGPDGRPWHLDRYIPGVMGGLYEPDNVVLSCSTCNLQKGGRDPSQKAEWDSQITLEALLFAKGKLTFLDHEIELGEAMF
jgi:5-methylcytosine-specific restriction endonuclease McrA